MVGSLCGECELTTGRPHLGGPMRGEPLRLTIDSTDDRDAAMAALGALFGVRLAVVADAAGGDTSEAAAASAPDVAAGAPRRRGAKSRSARTASTATRGGRSRSAGKAAPSRAVRSTRRGQGRDVAVSPTAPNAQIRSWAQGQGMAVASRGRIAASVVDAYRAANPA
jgi:hypothetical protein